MRIVLLLLVLLFNMVSPVDMRGVTECVKFTDNTDSGSLDENIVIVRIINPKGNKPWNPRMPMTRHDQYIIEVCRNVVKLHGQFDASVLSLYSESGILLCRINVPQGADEIRIPELSDKPVEVHINDGVNDYYGYINNNI